MSFDPPFPPPPEDPSGAPPPLPPADPPGGPPPGGTPWDRRDQIGFAGALVETTQQVLLQPRLFYEGMAVTGGVGGPLLYAVILGYIGVVASTVYNAVFSSVVGSSLPQLVGRPELERFLEVYGTWVGALSQLVTGPLWIVIGAFVGAGILHVVLMLVGGATADFEATFRVVAFGHAVNIITLLPFCGTFVSFAWWLVVVCIGLSVVHHISIGRAILAVLLPVGLCCCCCAGVFTLFASSLAAALGQAQ